MLRRVTIRNYKSIVDDTLELGRLNVLIGENGCGKSNILEALTLAAASMTGQTSSEDLFNRGVRVTRPDLMRTSFAEGSSNPTEEVFVACESASGESPEFRLHAGTLPDGSLGWEHRGSEGAESWEGLEGYRRSVTLKFFRALSRFVIYGADLLVLRGLEVISRRDPLGIHGEGLDVLLGSFSEEEFAALNEGIQCIRWIRSVELDRAGERRFEGLRLGRSRSNLYFIDRFMAADNNVFSAESVNEGALHVLFYLALFSSRRTPPIFGIDNIETGLNPQLCRDLIKRLAVLAAQSGKQALVTTHNPAILDGLNLHDDEQRLFVVYRTDEGYTRTRRIKVKPEAGEELKLSELWMRGYLGGLPPKGF